MKQDIKKLLDNIHPKDINKILRPHISNILKNDKDNKVTIVVNKKYAMHALLKPENYKNLLKGVINAFGNYYKTDVKVDSKSFHHDREMQVPHAIHF